MKRRKTEDKRVYAVFESWNLRPGFGYLIYKLDDSVDEQKPIYTLNSADYNNLGRRMAVFSLGPLVYFCGGLSTGGYQKDAYVLDTNSSQCFGIKPMNNPVPDPLVFGPIDGDKFYLINRVLAESVFSFEMLNTATNEWKSLSTIDYCGLKETHPALSHWRDSEVREFLTIDAYAVCDSNIYLSTLLALFVYSTEYDTWSVSGKPFFSGYEEFTNLPFVGKAYSMSGNIFLAKASWPKTLNYSVMPIALLEVFKSLMPSGQLVPLSRYWRKTPPLNQLKEEIFSDNYMHRLYAVRSGVFSYSKMLFDIIPYDLSLSEDDKVKVTNSNYAYQVVGDRFHTDIRHLFSVA